MEEITASQPPGTLDYRLLRGFPLRNHNGRVTFAPHDHGTKVTWQCDIDSKIPGLGPLFRVLVAKIFDRALAGLDTDLHANPPTVT